MRHCDSEKVLYHPAGEAHSDAFGYRGGAIFSIELEPRWTLEATAIELLYQLPWKHKPAGQAGLNQNTQEPSRA